MGDFRVYAIALIVGLFYLLNIPLTVSVVANGRVFAAGFGIFVYEGAVRRAMKNVRAGKKRKRRKKKNVRGKLKLLRFLLKHAHVCRLSLSGCLCTGDAMYTALLTGALWALSAASAGKFSCSVVPGFEDGKTELCALGMIRLRFGQNILSEGRKLISRIRERLLVWKSIRSKGL